MRASLARTSNSSGAATANETDQERNQRLQTLRQNNANRIHNKTNQQREHRLQTNREYVAILFQNETDEDREHRLQ